MHCFVEEGTRLPAVELKGFHLLRLQAVVHIIGKRAGGIALQAGDALGL